MQRKSFNRKKKIKKKKKNKKKQINIVILIVKSMKKINHAPNVNKIIILFIMIYQQL